MSCKRYLNGPREMRLADEIESKAMQILATDMIADPDTENDGKLIKWVMEKLGIWEDEPCRN